MTGTGANILLTRPVEASARFLGELRDAGVTLGAVISPVLRIVPRRVEVATQGYRGLIFTSVHGVAAMDGHPGVAGMRAFAVGARTAAAARGLGMVCRDGPGSAAALSARLLANPLPGPLLHVRGAHTRGDIAASLTAAGIQTDELVVYDQQVETLSDEARALLASPGALFLPVFSPRSAAALAAQVADAVAALRVVAISPAAGQAWSGPGELRIADAATSRDMCATISAWDGG